MVNMLQMTDLDLADKKVLIREDFNVPMKAGIIQSDARLQAALPTIKLALEKGARLMLCSHLGRPVEGEADDTYSLAPVAGWLRDYTGRPVRLEKDYLNGMRIDAGEVVVLENVRFNDGEKACDDELSQQMAALCDVFVMDAFASAHRAQASTYGVAKYAASACAGPLLIGEIKQLEKSLSHAKPPLLAVVGGAKVSTKLALLQALVEKVDILIVGGGIANTFLAAAGHVIGKSLYDADLVAICQEILRKAERHQTNIPMPVDVGVGKAFSQHEPCVIKSIQAIEADDIILDIGPLTAESYYQLVQSAGTLIWNGPVGVFELPAFAGGTKALADAIATSDAFSIAGGGDTIAAIEQFDIADGISYITTGGGAFLAYIEGKKLPAIAMLERRAAEA